MLGDDIIASQQACDACGANEVPSLIAVLGEYRVFRCQKCRLSFLSPAPTEARLEAFYRQFHGDSTRVGTFDSFEARMASDFPEKTKLAVRLMGKHRGRLLDVGCGKGFYVKECMGAGIEAVGVDLSESAVAFARNELGVEAIAGSLSAIQSTLGQFDVATMWATIEHLANPKAELQAIWRALRPGGYLAFDTGLGNDWLDRLLPGLVQWYDPPQHIYVFSRPSLEAICKRAGFRVLEVDCSYERTRARRMVKALRNAAFAVSQRVLAEVFRSHGGPSCVTRFPVGNLIRMVCQKPSP